MTYKLVFFDVDSTITSEKDGSIPPTTKVAIRRLMEKGIHVVAATGRPLSMCEELREIGIETFITANGGYAKHQQTVIHKIPFNKERLIDVMNFAEKMKHGLTFYTESLYMNGVKEEAILTALNETLSLADYPSTQPAILEEEVYLLCLFANDRVVDIYQQTFPYLIFKRWHPYILNVVEKEVSKYVAIKEVLAYFNVYPHEAMAFGDGDNDIDMVKLVGLGIAMGNGSQGIKTAADYVTSRASEGGISEALKKFNII